MKTNTAGDLDIHYLAMDLQSLQSVKDGAEAFLQQEEAITSQAPRLDLLINNAGVSTPRLKPNPHKTKQKHLAIAVAVADAQSGMQILAVPFKLTADKFESQWQTNFLAPFFLVKCLLPVLESTAENSTSNTRVRIVNVASEAALLPGAGPKEIDYAHPNLDHVKGSMAVW